MKNSMMQSTDDLVTMYRSMARIRAVEMRIEERYKERQMKCPTHLSIGQEAISVGVCVGLEKSDVVYSTHRCHADYLAKGGDMKRMIAELYGKETGCSHGRGGSMHLVDASVGMMGTSALVAGSMPLPVGAALSFKMRGEPHVGVAFFGDAAVEPGVFHECMNFAALYKLPVIFVCANNDRSTLTPRRERQPSPITERAAGYGIPGERVDGNDVIGVAAVARRAIARAREGDGPTLIEAMTYCMNDHVIHARRHVAVSPEVAEARLMWAPLDPIKRLREALLGQGVANAILETIEREAEAEVDEAFRFALESPSPVASELLRGVGDGVEVFDEPVNRGDRILSCTAAIAEATIQAMEADQNVFLMGLHVTDGSSLFGTADPVFTRFGASRVLETPIMEASLTGIAGGAALQGMRPLFVHARTGFMLLTMSQLFNELAMWSYMSGGERQVPVVIRAFIGRSWGQGGQHSQSVQALFAHYPGLHVVSPSNGYDAKGLLMTALTGHTPVVIIEHRLCHSVKTVVPAQPYRIPFGKARLVREGSDVTIVSVLQMVQEAEKAAEDLAAHGVSAEVLDLRSIRPWDKTAVCASVRKTGHLIVADTAWTEFGISAEIASYVTEREFSSLKSPPIRIGLPACPTPMAQPLEEAYYPDSRDIVAAAFRALGREVSAEFNRDGVNREITGGSPF
jgi:2-oxoisovalerate dehydrogenase E1 component